MGGKLRLGLHGHTAWQFDRSARSNRRNAAAVYENGAVFDWWFSWGEITLCTNQGQVGGGKTLDSRKECQEQNNR
jgi:hypothetical protein